MALATPDPATDCMLRFLVTTPEDVRARQDHRVDRETLSMVRSLAMKHYRRQQRNRRTADAGEQGTISDSATVLSLC